MNAQEAQAFGALEDRIAQLVASASNLHGQVTVLRRERDIASYKLAVAETELQSVEGLLKHASIEVEQLHAFKATTLGMVTTLWRIVGSHPNLCLDDRIAAMKWLDNLDGDA